MIFYLRQGVRPTSRRTLTFQENLLLAEGHAVGALILGRIALVGTNTDLVQGAVVLVFTMMGTLVDSTFNALVCVVVHDISSFLLGSGLV